MKPMMRTLESWEMEWTFSEIGRVGSGGRKGKGAQIKGSV